MLKAISSFISAIPVVGSALLVLGYIALIIGFLMNVVKTGFGLFELMTTTGVTNDMIIHTAARAVSLFVPIVNCIAGYF